MVCRLTVGRLLVDMSESPVSESSVSCLALRCRLLSGLQNLTPTSAGSGSCKTINYLFLILFLMLVLFGATSFFLFFYWFFFFVLIVAS